MTYLTKCDLGGVPHVNLSGMTAMVLLRALTTNSGGLKSDLHLAIIPPKPGSFLRMVRIGRR